MQPSMASTRERPERDGAQKTCLDALGTGAHSPRECAMRAVAPKDTTHDLGVLAHERLGTLLAGLHRLVALVALDVQAARARRPSGRASSRCCVCACPCGRWWPKASPAAAPRGSGSTTGSIIWPSMPSARIMTGVRYSSATSKAWYARSAISCTVEGAYTTTWKSPWPMSAGGLPVVGLGGLDAAKARAAALHVDDDAGQVGAGHIRDALALERDARRRRRRHHASAGRRCAVDHVDGRDLAFGLQIRAADLGHALGHVGGKLGLRRDGIAEEETAACADGRLRHAPRCPS